MLTDIKIRNTKPTDKPQKLFDGGGLFVLVTPQGGKFWRLLIGLKASKKHYPLTNTRLAQLWVYAGFSLYHPCSWGQLYPHPF